MLDPRTNAPVALGAAQAHAARAAVSLPWLTRLRWGGVAGQVVTVAIGHWTLGIVVPVLPALALIGVTVASNLLLARWLRAGGVAGAALCGGVLVLDTLVLTGLLHISGGPFNPFSVLYLVSIMLAAVVLGAGWTWSLAGLAVACYVSLFLLPAHAEVPHVHGDGALSLHLWGMLVAFVVAALLTAYFVVRLSAAIERRDAEIAAMREQATRTERLASLTTLAAGAAHELGTPLGTIAIAAKEFERVLERGDAVDAAGLRDDARLIRAEVERCRRILDQMATDAGETTGEAPVDLSVERLVRDVLDALPPDDAARVHVEGLPLAAAAALPRRAVVSAVANLVRNALDATTPPAAVRLHVAADERALRVTVQDAGAGMPAEVLARAVEPFFSTKPPGKGMGLGLFLARTLAEGLGGRLVIDSTPGAGATARLELPGAVSRGRERAVASELARSVLLVDDDEVFRGRLARAFRDRGWEVREAADLGGALRAAEEDTPEYVVVDLRLPDGSGLEVVRRLRVLDETTTIVVLTGYGSIATALDALRLGAVHYLTKPADVDDIIAGFARTAPTASDVTAAAPAPIADTPSLARVEWEHINRVLADSGGNISEAARRLGLHRRSLQRKLAKYPVPR